MGEYVELLIAQDLHATQVELPRPAVREPDEGSLEVGPFDLRPRLHADRAALPDALGGQKLPRYDEPLNP